MRTGYSTVPSLSRRSRGQSPQSKRAPFRTAESRRLVESYWRSVIESSGEPPLYHTFSDRYGGTRGVPFAARTADGSEILRATLRTSAAPWGSEDIFTWCMESSEAAMRAGNPAEARGHLQQALSHLQNADGGLTVAALASSGRGATATAADLQRTHDTAEVLRRLGKVALLLGNAAEALRFFQWSTEADPLVGETYGLRAACHERLMEPQAAFDEYEKFMKLTPPSMEVLAHCGKCAAESDNAAAAVGYLRRLLREAAAAAAAAASASASDVNAAAAAEEAAFYEAHAQFYLGVVQLREERAAGALEPSAAVRRLFLAAASNPAYVHSHEASVDEAVERGDYALAVHQLQSLQQMAPECADYHLRAAHVHHLRGDISGEVDALSEALDRHQPLSARRTTLLTRGTVFADKVGDLDRAVKDFSLAIAHPADDEADRCTPLAYMKRAEARMRRFHSGVGTSEDQDAALADYAGFLRCIVGFEDIDGEPGDDDGGAPAARRHAQFEEQNVCGPRSVTNALLILANGAFGRQDYDAATRFFARAMARGWQPVPPRPFNVSASSASASVSASPPSSPTRLVQEDGGLFDRVWLSLAHHVVRHNPVQEDIFRVTYEARDWTGGADLSAPAAGKKMGVGSGGGRVGGERKDAERTSTASPSVLYQLVDARYAALKALEPTVFSSLEEALRAVWGPYRAEVERLREDALAAKGGKRAKRHV